MVGFYGGKMVYENAVEKINSEWCWKRNAGENKSGALVKHGESGAKMYWNWRTCGNMMENAWKMAGTCWEDGVETRKTCGKIGRTREESCKERVALQ